MFPRERKRFLHALCVYNTHAVSCALCFMIYDDDDDDDEDDGVKYLTDGQFVLLSLFTSTFDSFYFWFLTKRIRSR